jgi:hypothetical protein
MDRDMNQENDLASYQTEAILNAALMNNLSNSIAALSTDGSTNQHMGQNQGSTLANEQQSVNTYSVNLFYEIYIRSRLLYLIIIPMLCLKLNCIRNLFQRTVLSSGILIKYPKKLIMLFLKENYLLIHLYLKQR